MFGRAVMIPGLESALDYDRNMCLTFLRGDSGSGSFQVDPLESAPLMELALFMVLLKLFQCVDIARPIFLNFLTNWG